MKHKTGGKDPQKIKAMNEGKKKMKIKTLSNKTRKGKYLYIKEKGKPARYFKLEGNQTQEQEETIKKYYEDKYVNKSTKAKLENYIKRQEKKNKAHKQQQEYIEKSSKKGTINENLQKGITTAYIPDIYLAGQKTLKHANTELILNLLKDKENLKLFLKPENQKKIAFRMTHEITVKGEQGETLLKMKKYNITLEKLKEELEKTIPKGMSYEGESDYDKQKQLKAEGYILDKKDGMGRTSVISVNTTFRKGA